MNVTGFLTTSWSDNSSLSGSDMWTVFVIIIIIIRLFVFFSSLISLMVSVDVKHHVYLLTLFLYHVLKSAGQLHLLPRVYMLKIVLLFP